MPAGGSGDRGSGPVGGRAAARLLSLAGAAGLAAPAAWLRLTGAEPAAVPAAIVFGLGIVGGAFLLTWATDVAQLDIAKGLAVAILAIVAVLPEYAVDLYFAWAAARRPGYDDFVMANMTGANRLLVGFGWPLVVLLVAVRFRRREVSVHRGEAAGIVALGVASLYAFLLPVKGTLSLWDAVVLVGLFGLYLWRVAGGALHEPELVGPAALLGRLSRPVRRASVAALFIVAGGAILLSAEPFAESLIESGRALGVREYLLVQWIAPLASEAPEVVIVCFWALRGDAAGALQTLVSSKVNQWLLLVGTIPIVYSISLGAPGALDLNAFQEREIVLTAAQSLLAAILLVDRSLDVRESVLLLVLFTVQLVIPDIRMEVSLAYLGLAVFYLVRARSGLPRLLREAVERPR